MFFVDSDRGRLNVDKSEHRTFKTSPDVGFFCTGGAVDLVGCFQGFLLLHHVCGGFNCSKLDWISPPLWPFCPHGTLLTSRRSFVTVHLWREDRVVSWKVQQPPLASLVDAFKMTTLYFCFNRWESLILVVMYAGYILVMKWVRPELYWLEPRSRIFLRVFGNDGYK